MGKTAFQTTNKPNARSAVAVEATNKRKRNTTAPGKGKSIEGAQSRKRIAYSPSSGDEVYVNDNGDVELVRGPTVITDRETTIKTSLKIRQDNKVKCEKSLQSLNAFLEKRNFFGENSYKYVMQKFLHGEASSIDRKIREKIYDHIKERYLDVQHVFVCLGSEILDDEIARNMVEAIEEVTEELGVHLKELVCVAHLAKSIFDEPFKEFQLAKGSVVRNCINCWLNHNVDYFESRKKAKLWVDNPTASFSTIDPDKNGKPGYCIHGKAFIIPGLE